MKNRNEGKNEKRNRRRLCFLLAFVLLFACSLSSSVSYADNLSDAKSELADIQAQIKDLQSQINSGKAEATSLQKKINTLDKSITAAEEAIDKLGEEIAVTKGKVADAQTALNEKEAEVRDQDEMMGLRIRNMYKNGDISILEIILNSESVSDFMTNLDMATRIMENDVALLEDLETQYLTLQTYRTQLETLQNALEVQQSDKLEQQISLENSRKEVLEVKASVESNTKLLEAQEDALNAEANALTEEILKLQTDAAYVGGTMVWPCPASYKVTSPFGYRIHPILKVNKLHTGIDIGVATGNKVLAVNAGTVIKAAYSSGYGYMVMVDHGGGIVTLYAHNSKLLVKTGDYVSQGQQIASSGSTGQSTGPHLHFEVRLNGVYQDPLSAEYLGTFAYKKSY